MTRWAVGYLSRYDNDIIIEICEGNTWQQACKNHTCIGTSICDTEYDLNDDTSIDEFLAFMTNCDKAIGCTKISE